MIVICLDGEEKSTSPLSQQLQMAGFSVLGSVLLEEEFPQMKPGSFGAENIWISGWIERLLQKKIEVGEDSERAVLFFDHSPFMKSDNITELGPLIEAQLADLKVFQHFFFFFFSISFFFFSISFFFFLFLSFIFSLAHIMILRGWQGFLPVLFGLLVRVLQNLHRTGYLLSPQLLSFLW